MRRERKVVTVLFADLVGFTSRAERLDPEDVDEILAPYHERLRRELERFGGTVEKFIGDAVMAVFGAPHAHEDDPERAVRAALAIRDWALDEDGLEVRIAVNSGEALVKLDARSAEGESMVSGDVVNTAARMQTAAPVNGILVGETTYRATDGVVDYRAAETVAAKGKAERVRVWEAVAARSRFGVDVVHGGAPLVGRGRELALLADALGRVRVEREPQLVTLVGVPGIGKSRLVYELMQVADAEPERIRWRQGRCLPYGDGVTFWALGEIVKSHAGIFETDEAAQAEPKLAQMVAATLGESADADWVEARLRPLIGLAAERGGLDDRLSEAFAAWVEFFEALADELPLVVVIEDLHWADPELLDFLDELVDRARGPILAVATARPELLERRPGWGGGKANAVTLSLSPLADDDTARLLGALLDRAVLPADAQQAVLARAGGNPLFAEQYARMLAEHGDTAELPLPETVQGIIAARLDGLASAEKELLQDAAVHGKVFWAGAVASMRTDPIDETLRSLERKEFLRRQRRSSVAGETEYTFRHVLLRDVAYAQIPRRDRATKHAQAAQWLESLAEDRDDHVELLADHLVRALELARAAGGDGAALERRAAIALRDAGLRAAGLNAHATAGRFCAQALELWPQEEPGRGELLLELGRARWFSEQSGATELEEAIETLVDEGERERAAEAALVLADHEWYQGRAVEARACVARAIGLVADLGPSRGKAYVLAQSARLRMLAGERTEVMAQAREAIALAESLGLHEIKAHALCTLGTTRVNLGDAGGIADCEESVELARRVSSPELVRCLNNLAYSLELLGDPKRTREVALESVGAAERFGIAPAARFARASSVWDEYDAGEWDEALRVADGLIAEIEGGSPHVLEGIIRSGRARILLARGDVAGALEESSLAAEAGLAVGDRQTVFPSLVCRAQALLAAGLDAEAQSVIEEVVAFRKARVDPHHGFRGDAEVVETLATLLGPARFVETFCAGPRRATVDAAEHMLAGEYAAAAEIYEQLERLPSAALCHLRDAHAAAAAGRRADVDEPLRKALAFYRSVKATRYVREAEELLKASA